MYYLDIIPAICFLIGHQLFAPYMKFALIRHYSIENPDNNNIDSNKDKCIYEEMHTAG